MTKNRYILVGALIILVLVGFGVYQNSVSPATVVQQETVEQNDQRDEEEPAVGVTLDSNDQRVDGVLGESSEVPPQADSQNVLAVPDVRAEKVEIVANPVNEVVIDMIGTNYDFDIKEIKVQKGDVVTINLQSDGGFHDWVVDTFSAATERINEGGMTSVTFTADQVGTFQYYCSVGRHQQLGMVGYLTVED